MDKNRQKSDENKDKNAFIAIKWIKNTSRPTPSNPTQPSISIQDEAGPFFKIPHKSPQG